MKTCKDCKRYIPNKNINNCSMNIVGSVKPYDSVCYAYYINDKQNYSDV